ncbi:DUF2382 domain protein [Cyanobacterium sp. HL-69]|uniref:DUF2382 domain-containing protein n=1 Tax=Cyanobacterium sp. HL-69 TaxID=2054282 RepID=UPI000CA36146|nr:DUF2382 domain protein [Cyanobacterium sp. HL-69]
MNTNNNTKKRAIGTFPTRKAAEQSLHELKNSGFAMDQVSVVAQDSKQNETIVEGINVSDHAGNKADDGAKMGALSGGALGTLTGLLVGLGVLAIPGVGPILMAGAVATSLATTVTGGAIGAAAGSLVGALIGLGIPEERAKVYNDRVSAGEYLVMVDGTDAEIAKAEAILNHSGIEEWGVYDVPAKESATTNHTADTAPSHEMNDQVTPRPSESVTHTPKSNQPTSSNDVKKVKLHEERMVMNKDRQKIGEVEIGKRVEVETANVAVPLTKERLVIVTVPPSSEKVSTDNIDAFHNSDTVRVEVYEDTPTIHKETFVREEVTIGKEVTQETVNAEENLRREELDVDTQGNPFMDNSSNGSDNPRR